MCECDWWHQVDGFTLVLPESIGDWSVHLKIAKIIIATTHGFRGGGGGDWETLYFKV